MFRNLIIFATDNSVLLIIASFFLGFVSSQVFHRGRSFLGLSKRQSSQTKLLIEGLDNIPQAFCVFDHNERLVACNKRYAELHQLTGDLIRPGTTIRKIFEHRVAVGKYPGGDPKKYIEDRLASIRDNKPHQDMLKLNDGTVIQTSRKPMLRGGWVATDEDVTERQHAEQQRVAAAVQEKHRLLVEDAIISFRGKVESLLSALSENSAALRSTAATLSVSSSQTSQRAAGAVHSSNQASASVSVAAAVAEQLLMSIFEISQKLHAATDLVQIAVADAHAMNEEIASLASAAQQIGDVVKVIRNIASQTNLLALNATIEAARAGQSGKGFAVVASEVKSLAVQTASATEKIVEQIAAVQSSTMRSVESIRQNTERMQEINDYASAVTASIEEQSAATGEIARSVADAAQETKVIASVLVDVDGGAVETRSSAEKVLVASESVEIAAAELRGHVESFLRKTAIGG